MAKDGGDEAQESSVIILCRRPRTAGCMPPTGRFDKKGNWDAIFFKIQISNQRCKDEDVAMKSASASEREHGLRETHENPGDFTDARE